VGVKITPPSCGHLPYDRGGVRNILRLMNEKKTNNTPQLNNRQELKELRRNLRTYGTAAEATLWGMLKNRQIKGLRWRRQFSVGAYILDFYCPEKKVCIELDGNTHYTMSGMEYDQQRKRYLEECGIRVLRFENKMVWQAPEIIIAEIERII
jgi:very-short-patch-repair endonuclease